ncbi:MAG: glycerol kinase GlpK [Rhodospirillales bacterium]|nr:glycerol kinase GlpK [Rhodospirillales bacterium]MCB9965685.1 glycerol kinase GlpK [Rhodospirillales bacterium]
MRTDDPLLLAIDQGTTSSRAIAFSKDGLPRHVAQKELTQHYPEAGWVEQDANDIWQDTLSVTRDVIRQAGGAQNIAAIGITNQRETVILWDRRTGDPVCRAIVWQDRRTAKYCQSLKAQGLEDMVSAKTGLLIDPYFSCTKIKWALDNIPNAATCAAQGALAFGTVESYLLWKLTGGAVHATDATNAARTGLFNIVTQSWDDDLLALYGIPKEILPQVMDNAASFGTTHPDLFGTALPVAGMAGDQQAALIGQGCFQRGMMKSTYGTGCFALMNIGPDFVQSRNRLLTTPAYRFGGEVTYAIEGSIFMAGAVLQWLRDELQMIQKASDSEALATSVPDNNGVYLIPAFTGLGAPHWQPEARAAILGLTRGANKAHIARAALEAQAYQTMDLLAAMENDSGIKADRLRVDGGLVANRFVCQFLADILRVQIDLPQVTETTALGAAFLAGLQVGIYDSLEDISRAWRPDRTFAPHMSLEESQTLYEGWQRYLDKVK